MADQDIDFDDDDGEIPTFDALPSAPRQPGSPAAPSPAPILESRLSEARAGEHRDRSDGGGDAAPSPRPWSGFVGDGAKPGTDPDAEWRAVQSLRRSPALEWVESQRAASGYEDAAPSVQRTLPKADPFAAPPPPRPTFRIVNAFDPPPPPTRYVRVYTDDGTCRLVVEGSAEDPTPR